MPTTERIGELQVLRLEAEGPLLASGADASALIGTTWGQEIDVVVVPVARLAPDFFRLSTGLAGDLLQKFVNHRLRLVVLGDVSAFVAQSEAFRDFVREANRGGQVSFVADDAELRSRLG
jgi:hypothetical protein